MVRLMVEPESNPVRALSLGGVVAVCSTVLAFSIGPALVLLAPLAIVEFMALRQAWPLVAARVVALVMLVLAGVAGGYPWWAFGVALNADDADVPEPASTGFIGPALITFVVAGASLFFAGLMGASVSRRRAASR